MTRIVTCLIATLAPVALAAPPQLAAPPMPIHFHRMVAVDGKLYQFGGMHQPRNQLDIYDTKTNKWSKRTLPFEPSVSMYPAVIDGKIFVLDAMGKSLRRYEPANDRWTDLAPCPTRRVNGMVIAFDSKVYVVGAYSPDVNADNCVEVYDPATNKWTIGPPLPDYKVTKHGGDDHFHLAAVLDGMLHVVGHYFGGKDHWVLDDGKWKRLADAPAECGWKSAALESIGGKIYLFDALHPGEEDADNIFTYGSDANAWSPVGRLPNGFPHAVFASARVGSAVYFTGGAGGERAMYRYDAETKRWASSGN